jgi:hypothetical protein
MAAGVHRPWLCFTQFSEEEPMSAYIVDDDLIDLLVTYAYGGGPNRVYSGDPAILGQTLIDENYRSVNCRYRETTEAPRYKFVPFTGPMNPLAVIQACGKYDYQACETEDYRDTPAAQWIRKIERKAIRALPGYDKVSLKVVNPGRSNKVAQEADGFTRVRSATWWEER